MNGVLDKFSGFVNNEVMEGLKDSFDANAYFFNNKVEIYQMYLVLGLSIVVLLGVYLGIVFLKGKKKKEE